MISVTYCCQITYRNAPCRTRTCDRRIRNPLLYPAELRALFYASFGGLSPGTLTAARQTAKATPSKGQKLDLSICTGITSPEDTTFVPSGKAKSWLLRMWEIRNGSFLTWRPRLPRGPILDTGRKLFRQSSPSCRFRRSESPGRRSP
jgi:hypothetical protein